MAESPAQRPREEKPAHRSGFAPASPAPGMLALTQDAALVDTLRAAVDAGHHVAVVTTDTALIDRLLASQVRAVLIDSAACHQPIAQFTDRLRNQFPDLVLVVAGTVSDQGSLASQITDGRVYRFLHKPVSAQRVKLFVESAFRRSDTSTPPAVALPAAPARAPRKRPPAALVAGVLALAIATAVAIAWSTRRAPPVPAARPVAAAATPSTVATAPGSARSAPQAPPARAAAAGPDAAIDRLLEDAEKALLSEKVDEAARLVTMARDLRPDHPRVAFVATQVGKERERQLLAAARKAAADGNLERAIAVLESGSATGSELIGAAKRELQQQEAQQQAGGFLALARARIGSGALLEPAQDNARFYIESARALAPEAAGLPAAEDALRSALVGAANTAIGAGDLAAAERWIAASEEGGVTRADLAELRRALQGARIENRAAALDTLAQQFNERLQQNRLVDPATDSARAWYLRMRDTDPQAPATLAARDALGKAMIAEARGALARTDPEGAERWVAEAEAIGPGGTDITNARRDIATQRALEGRANEVVPASRLSLVRKVEPQYPADAQARGQSGWVDLEFTVSPKGTVGDVRVIAATPAGVFDQAASDAIARWRFRPVERNGVPVAQRAKLRIRFDLQ